ncbi:MULTISPECIES: substrate-binding periplasmic protein [unclassified Coleofasciculus]|uniref:substrate-binding periplasmic protein n=1 Tax=unclassified Coleofasciculus TaxID=2692782 RepID=UPI00187E8E7E|nr:MULTISPECIES: transporter substrate-binding domain-containing protein [unclassified Coleofasciculus]MBE9129501.1 transporter substrate-binding domain-containing protein [Coleofasciculus sp. LEGE 07081]MBE9152085.1 transporter substrate-binding domain-containing protein [Coleofasciculus sp. LEGE 07092]
MMTRRLISRFLITLCTILIVRFLLPPAIPAQVQQTPVLGQDATEQSENSAGQQATSEGSPLVVGVYDTPPFALKNGNDWDGIGVHLWREIARDLNLDYQWQEVEQDKVIDQVQDGTVDMAITAIATASDEQRVDFTHSYYTTSLGVAQRPQRSLLQIVTAILSPRFLQITLWLSVIFIIIGVLAWAFEHNTNDQFEKNPVRGIWTGFWWAGVTMSTIGYGDKTPKSIPGRILALLWMLVAMGITATLTASITSVLTVDSPIQAVQSPQNWWQRNVGSVPETESSEYLQNERIQFQSFSAPLDGLRAVQDGDVDIFVYSAAPLRYLNRNSLKGTLNIQATDLQARRYAFALPEEHELYDALNQKMLQEMDKSDWRNLVKRYIPKPK